MPRRLPIALLTIWPGLAQIWTGQEVLGLILATVFAATLTWRSSPDSSGPRRSRPDCRPSSPPWPA